MQLELDRAGIHALEGGVIMRKDTYRVPSDDVQGDGSWVEFRAITRGEWKEFLAADQETTEQLLPGYIAAWNWKDRDGVDLPLPPELDALTTVEVGFLVRCIVAPPAGTKN